MTYEQLTEIASRSGFTAWAEMDPATLEPKQEVRDMCASNSCGQYGKRWSCPPGCGTLEECTNHLRKFPRGILVQTCGDIEDGFDFETMMEIEADHKEHVKQMYETLRHLRPMHLSRRTLPLPGENDCLHGSLRSCGAGGLQGKQSEILLWF